MSRTNGRDLQFKVGGVVLAVLNTKTVNIDNTEVDVTGDTDNGFITVLGRPGTRRIAFEGSGFTQDESIRDIAIQGSALLQACTIEWLSADGAGTVIYAVDGSFFLSNFSETGASDGGLEFSASFASSGEFTGAVVP